MKRPSLTVSALLLMQAGGGGASIRRGLVSAFASSFPPSSSSSLSLSLRAASKSSTTIPFLRQRKQSALALCGLHHSSPPFFLGSSLLRGGCSLDSTPPGSSSSQTSSQRKSNGVPPTTALFASTASAEESSSSSPPPSSSSSEDDDDINTPELLSAVQSAARSSLSIAGPSLTHSTFGTIPYLTTTNLDTTTPPQHRVIFVLGGPGAGKGTQSSKIVDHYKAVHLSVGELLREARSQPNNPHNALLEDCLTNGKIVPVEISLALLRDAMDQASITPDPTDGQKYKCRIFLVDGFPRNFDNLLGWVKAMSYGAASCWGALVYDCHVEELERRILERAKVSGRSDDNLISLRKRFVTFRKDTMPVVRALEEVERIQDEEEVSDGDGGGGSLIKVKHIVGDRTIDEVWEGTKGVEEVWEGTKEAMDGFVMNDILSANAKLLDAVDKGDWEQYANLCEEGMMFGGDDDSAEVDSDASVAEKQGDDKGGKSKEERLKEIFDAYEIAKVDLNMNSSSDDATKDEPSSSSLSTGSRQISTVSNASVQLHDGTKATVSYDRTIQIIKGGDSDSDKEKEDNVITTKFREMRVWSHGERGWLCIHFARTPL